jgi:hypothetical protein
MKEIIAIGIIIYGFIQFQVAIVYAFNWEEIIDNLKEKITLLNLFIVILTLPAIILSTLIVSIGEFLTYVVNKLNDIEIFKRKK